MMVHFTDGPAAGKTLRLTRAPIYLRVVRCGDKIDALDQPSDRARPGEAIFAYKLTSHDGAMHINSRDRKTGRHTGGWTQIASYAVIEPQPDDTTMRDNQRWAEWADARYAEEKGDA